MKIGVFSKLGYPGGSELRSAYMCTALAKYTDHKAYLLCERDIHPEVQKVLHKDVKLCRHTCTEAGKSIFKDMDHILVVNTDSRDYPSKAFWAGKSDRHSVRIDLSHVQGMSFLFNYITTPALLLPEMQSLVPRVTIFCANDAFKKTMQEDPKYACIKDIPMHVISSPIDLALFTPVKTQSSRIRIGRHSVPSKSKFNPEILICMKALNEAYGDKIEWDFMGSPPEIAPFLQKYTNVTTRPAYSLPVSEYLQGIDIFLHYPMWKAGEAWSRSIAEAIICGSPVVAADLPGGTRMQVQDAETGFLGKDFSSMHQGLKRLVEDPALLQHCREQCIEKGKTFGMEEVVQVFLKGIA
jgi:glycosyltransferase involved in cell wall biosynthesis